MLLRRPNLQKKIKCKLFLTSSFFDQLGEHFQIRNYFKNIKPVTVDQIISRKCFFNRRMEDMHKPFTLILDLDETLIHSHELLSPYDALVEIKEEDGSKTKVRPTILHQTKFNIRPYVQEFFEAVSKMFEIIIFTASESAYADPIIDHLDPEGRYVAHRFFREQCIEIETDLFIKDLRVLGQRPLEKTCIVDNALYSYIINVKNGIPILPFTNDKKDNQLLKLADFLLAFKPDLDIRKLISHQFCYKEFFQAHDSADFLDKIQAKHGT